MLVCVALLVAEEGYKNAVAAFERREATLQEDLRISNAATVTVTAERDAQFDALTLLAIGSWSVTLADINMWLETATFAVGLVAGIFAMFFHIRRYFRSRKRDKQAKCDPDS